MPDKQIDVVVKLLMEEKPEMMRRWKKIIDELMYEGFAGEKVEDIRRAINEWCFEKSRQKN